MYVDKNDNQTYDAGEPVFANATVTAGSKSDTTDSNGYYFINLDAAGDYTVTGAAPLGYTAVTQNRKTSPQYWARSMVSTSGSRLKTSISR
jgi:hypothetical protein